MINTARTAAPIVLLAAAALAGCHSGTPASSVQSANANPTVSADIAKTRARAEAIINNCAAQLGGTKGPGISALLSVPVMTQLATHSGRTKFETCVFPNPAKRAAAGTCIQQVISNAGLSLVTGSARQHAAQSIFACVEQNM